MSIDYEDAKEEFKRSVLVPMIARLRDAIDNESTWTNKKTEIVKEMAKKIEDAGIVEPEEISQYLKKFFKERAVYISDDIVERACGEGRTRRTKPKKDPRTRISEREELGKKVIEQTTNGRNYVPSYRPDKHGVDPAVIEEMDRDSEELPNDRITKKNDGPVEIDLDERNQAIIELEEQRERDREAIKTMQKQIDNLQEENRLIELKAAEAETRRKATQQDFDKLKERTEELEEALKKSIQKEGFAPASQLPKMPEASSLWLPVDDIIILFARLKKARDEALEKWQQKRRVLIEWEANTGRVTGARLADV